MGALAGVTGWAAVAVGGSARGLPGATLTYRAHLASVVNPGAGTRVEAYADALVFDARVEGVTAHEVAVGGGGGPVQFGDVVFRFAAEDLAAALAQAPSRDLTTADRIVHAGAAYRVIQWERTAQGALLRVVARRGT